MGEKERSFGETIKALRREKELTQRQVAAAVKVDVTYLSKLENDRGEAPGEDLVGRLARELGGEEEELLALAGRVPGELRELAASDVEFARFLRKLPSMDEPQRQRLYRQAKRSKG